MCGSCAATHIEYLMAFSHFHRVLPTIYRKMCPRSGPSKLKHASKSKQAQTSSRKSKQAKGSPSKSKQVQASLSRPKQSQASPSKPKQAQANPSKPKHNQANPNMPKRAKANPCTRPGRLGPVIRCPCKSKQDSASQNNPQ